jgi:hypothetical protein
MFEIIREIFKGKWGFKKILGLVILIIGLILHLVPLFPASGIVIVGLELLGVRLLLQDKIKAWNERRKNKKQL